MEEDKGEENGEEVVADNIIKDNTEKEELEEELLNNWEIINADDQASKHLGGLVIFLDAISGKHGATLAAKDSFGCRVGQKRTYPSQKCIEEELLAK